MKKYEEGVLGLLRRQCQPLELCIRFFPKSFRQRSGFTETFVLTIEQYQALRYAMVTKPGDVGAVEAALRELAPIHYLDLHHILSVVNMATCTILKCEKPELTKEEVQFLSDVLVELGRQLAVVGNDYNLRWTKQNAASSPGEAARIFFASNTIGEKSVTNLKESIAILLNDGVLENTPVALFASALLKAWSTSRSSGFGGSFGITRQELDAFCHTMRNMPGTIDAVVADLGESSLGGMRFPSQAIANELLKPSHRRLHKPAHASTPP